MTLNKMKLAVAGLIPQHVEIGDWTYYGRHYVAAWKDTERFITDREWLEVCRLAEDIFKGESSTWDHYYKTLLSVCSAGHPFRENNIIAASADQRLEAICRVKWPEKFANEGILINARPDNEQTRQEDRESDLELAKELSEAYHNAPDQQLSAIKHLASLNELTNSQEILNLLK